MSINNIWFMGTGKFAALCLEGLIHRDVPISKILTGLPTRSGRGGKENPSAVELTASLLGRSVERTGKLIENQTLLRELRDASPALIFVIDFGQIIREPFLSRLCMNIHPSLLPEYRGAAPIQRALFDGKSYTGVSVFRLVQAMDAGDIVAQRRIELSADDNASDLYVRLADIGCELAAEAVGNIASLTFTPQDDSLATFAPKLEKSEFTLSFTMPAERFANTVRALDMSGGAFAVIRNKRVKVWRARVREDIPSASPGQVIAADNNPIISCNDFCVELLDVQSEGKNRVSGSEWSRGLRLKAGDIL